MVLTVAFGMPSAGTGRHLWALPECCSLVLKQGATKELPRPFRLLSPCAQDTPSGHAVCRVSLAFPQIRTDRRKVGFAHGGGPPTCFACLATGAVHLSTWGLFG